MEEKGNQVQGVHKVTIANRMQGTICGVSDVLSFDVGGDRAFDGPGDAGDQGGRASCEPPDPGAGGVDLDGKIDSLTYSGQGRKKEKSESFLGRLFR